MTELTDNQIYVLDLIKIKINLLVNKQISKK